MVDGKKISKLLKEKNITSEQLSNILSGYGIKLGVESIKKYRTNSVNIPSNTVSALAEILNTTEQDLYENSKIQKTKIVKTELKENLSSYLSYLPKNNLPNNLKAISLIDGYIGAGSSGLVEDIEIIDTIYIDINTIAKAYRQNKIKGLKVIGDSMKPYVDSDDIVLYSIIEPNFTLNDGKYIIRVDDRIMLKNIQFKINGDIIISSENKIYSDEVIQKDSQIMQNFDIIGFVVGRILKN